MKLLSGNPDGFDFVIKVSEYNEKGQQMNYLLPLLR